MVSRDAAARLGLIEMARRTERHRRESQPADAGAAPRSEPSSCRSGAAFDACGWRPGLRWCEAAPSLSCSRCSLVLALSRSRSSSGVVVALMALLRHRSGGPAASRGRMLSSYWRGALLDSLAVWRIGAGWIGAAQGLAVLGRALGLEDSRRAEYRALGSSSRCCLAAARALPAGALTTGLIGRAKRTA